MLVMKHKRFRLQLRPRFYWSIRALLEDHERLRGQVEDFINAVGAAKVVSVSEGFAYGCFEVIVWYREEAEGKTQPVKDVMAEL